LCPTLMPNENTMQKTTTRGIKMGWAIGQVSRLVDWLITPTNVSVCSGLSRPSPMCRMATVGNCRRRTAAATNHPRSTCLVHRGVIGLA
jgi:hypothetical protein